MKTVYLVRHSKAESDNPLMKDIKRVLTRVGIERAEKMALILTGNYILPDLIFSSNAARAYQTAVIFARQFGIPVKKIEIDHLLYGCHYHYYNELVSFLNNGISSVMIVGHNPAISHAVSDLIKKEIDYLPPCGIACIGYETENWEKLSYPDTFEILDPRILLK